MRWLLYFALCLLCLNSCRSSAPKTVYMPVETTRTLRDTVRLFSLRTDTVMRLDSVFRTLMGDTLILEHWRTDIKVRTVHDSVFRAFHDTLHIREPYPVEVVKTVPAELSAWQQVRIHTGEAAMLAVLVALVLWLRRRRKR